MTPAHVHYEAQRLLVELDGRIGHTEQRDRWDDMDRDLLAAIDGMHGVSALGPHRAAGAWQRTAAQARLDQVSGPVWLM